MLLILDTSSPRGEGDDDEYNDDVVLLLLDVVIIVDDGNTENASTTTPLLPSVSVVIAAIMYPATMTTSWIEVVDMTTNDNNGRRTQKKTSILYIGNPCNKRATVYSYLSREYGFTYENDTVLFIMSHCQRDGKQRATRWRWPPKIRFFMVE